ncbi:MAG: hypothetical protein WC582_01745 [Patescibacteria group bacterium]
MKKKVLVVSTSGGSAEILTAYIKKNVSQFNFICLVNEPARTVFTRKGLKKIIYSDVKKIKSLLDKKKIEMVLTGTSRNDPLDLEYINYAKEKKIKSVVFLEHWVNYRERFGYPQKNWREKLPNEIWVGDKYAFKMAKKLFSGLTVKLVPNPYFTEVKEEYKIAKKNYKKEDNILIIGQPFAEGEEYKVFNDFLNFFASKGFKDKIILRLHPSEDRNKYNSIISSCSNRLSIKISRNKNLVKDLIQSSCVLGINSMALYVSALCGKKVVSLVLKNKDHFRLPFNNINKIFKVEDISKFI